MTTTPVEILDTVKALLDSRDQLSLATHGMRIWSEVVDYRMEGEQIACDVADGSQSLANIALNPRVSFCIGDPRAGRSVHGNGIAKSAAAAGRGVVIYPYRFTLRCPGTEGSAGQVIEKRRLEWRSVAAGPVGARAPTWVVPNMKFWLRAARSISFPLSILPVLLGTVVAFMKGSFDPVTFLLALLGGVAAHAGINLLSDFNDFRKGVDTTDALSTHPGALVDEVVLPESIQAASFLMFLIATATGALLLLRAGPLVLCFGVVGILGGYGYTGGVIAYKYRGWGELFVSLLMGPLMVLGAYYVQTRRIDLLPFLLSVPLGSLVGSVTLANNMRDLQDDRWAGIFTLPMGMRVRSVKRVYYAMLILPFVIVAGIVAYRHSFFPMLLAFLSIPTAVGAIRKVRAAGDSPDEVRAGAAKGRYPLNSIKLHLRFGLLLVLGCALVALFSALLENRP